MTQTQDKLAHLPPARREAVLRLLEEAARNKDTGPSRRRTTGPVPLSASQNTLWLVDRIEPGRASYNVPFCFKLTGPLDVAALARALTVIVNRHESLRSYVLVEGEQFLQGTVPADVEVTLDQHEVASTQEAEALANSFAETGFDLTRPPLWRAHLIKVSEDETWFIYNVHHIIFDGWSASVFQPELTRLYSAFVDGTAADLGDEPLQFADFSEWQRETLTEDRAKEHADYWRKQLEGFENLALPTDRPLPSEVTYDGTFVSVRIPGLASRGLEVARAFGTSSFTVYATAFGVLLNKYTGQDDIVFGSPTANRNYPSVESTIGFFVNMLPLRLDVAGDPSFEDLLRRVDTVIKDARVHSELPFEQIVSAVRPPRDPSRSAIFQIAMTMQDASGEPLALSGVDVEPVWLDPGSSRFQMSWNFVEHADDLEVNIEMNTAIFDPPTVAAMAARFGRAFDRLTSSTATPISTIGLLTDEEAAAEVAAGVGPTRERSTGTIISRFMEKAAAHGGDLAVSAAGDRCTYDELSARVATIRHAIEDAGASKGAHVGVLTHRDRDLPATLLALASMGAVYVPLDPGNPALRNVDVIEDAGIAIVVGNDAHLGPVLEQLGNDGVVTTVVLDDFEDDGRALGSIDSVEESDPAYIIYTSGSAGRPKGVIVTHHNVVNFIDNVTDVFDLTPADRVLGYASVGFDVSIFEMLSALLNGASVHLVPHEDRLDIDELQRFIAEHRVTVSDIPPSVMSLLDPTAFSDLRIVFVGGEAFSSELVDAWGRGRRFFNGYGPTECTVTTTIFECATGSGVASPPIGLAMGNHVAHVVDGAIQLVAPGIPGELAVGGDGLAAGYWNRPDQNEKAFVANPFGTTADGRLYLSGDIVRRDNDGQLVYLGRRDAQVKINGVRIELGEIEACMRTVAAVKQATVTVWKDDSDRKKLVGYVVTRDGHTIDVSALRTELGRRLVPAMVPSFIVELDELPLNRSGKVDRSRLPDPDTSAGSEQITEPRNETERQLIDEVYLPLLSLDKIGIGEGFFESGGSSLQAAQLLSRIRKLFDVEIPLTKFFRDSSVQTMALRIDRARAAQMDPEELVAMLETMSDSDAERLLAGEDG